MGRSWRSIWRPIDLIRLALLIVMLCFGAVAQAGEPIKIGMSMALTGPLAGTGKAALLGTQIWVEDINAKGGILGRPIQLNYYDDQSNPSLVPGIYTKLIDVDKVDLVASGYATNMVAPAMPIVMGHGLIFVGLYARSTVLFVPGSGLTVVGGALFGPVWGTLWNLTGATLGATFAFLTARYVASDWVSRTAGERLARVIRGVEEEGWRFVAFVRLVPLFPFHLDGRVSR